MSTVMLAVFTGFNDAESVRTELIRRGVPANRVEVTARDRLGQFGSEPDEYSYSHLAQYFGSLLRDDACRGIVEELAKRVAAGSVATVALLSPGKRDTVRAKEVLEAQGALQVLRREQVDSDASNAALAEYLLPEYAGASGRFYMHDFVETQSNEPV